VNVKRLLNLTYPISQSQNSLLFNLYSNLKHFDFHNLTQIKIPDFAKLTLSLGLKFSYAVTPDKRILNNSLKEALRKVGWFCHFYPDNNQGLSKIQKVTIDAKKRNRKFDFHSNVENIIFNSKVILKKFNKALNLNTNLALNFPEEILSKCANFINHNNIVIIDSDKNAGTCIMNRSDYNTQVFNLLDDKEVFIPSTYLHFDLAMNKMYNNIVSYAHTFPKELNIKNLFVLDHRPAKFYTLPKVHKTFDKIPPGRPISSTINTANKYISKLIDAYLQQIMNFMPDVLIDTNHFLILLSELNLIKDHKYILITADIVSLYTNIDINLAISHCVTEFENYARFCDFTCTLSARNLFLLLNWSLKYSFCEYNKNLYFQHKGIQMGNNASVSIANIVCSRELEKMLNIPELIFKKRFVDDIFIIADITHIQNNVIDSFVSNIFRHDFLSFTHKHSASEIDFLDLTVILKKNVISTKLFKKPMTKQSYLHFFSNHPPHCKKSLPYSCGLRIIKCHSNRDEAFSELKLLMDRFKLRGYPNSLLNEAFRKITLVDRNSLLTPKSPFLIKNLLIHNPSSRAIQSLNPSNTMSEISRQIFVVVPFFKNIFNLKYLFSEFIKNEIVKETLYEKALEELKIVISFSRANSIRHLVNR